jgi:rubrerythrin
VDDATQELVRGLNEDLRGEFQAGIMYRLYASMVQGPYRQELRNFYVQRRKQAEDAGEYGLAAQFDDIISDETHHRDELRQMLARWP